jgi:hypothetical protein
LKQNGETANSTTSTHRGNHLHTFVLARLPSKGPKHISRRAKHLNTTLTHSSPQRLNEHVGNKRGPTHAMPGTLNQQGNEDETHACTKQSPHKATESMRGGCLDHRGKLSKPDTWLQSPLSKQRVTPFTGDLRHAPITEKG